MAKASCLQNFLKKFFPVFFPNNRRAALFPYLNLPDDFPIIREKLQIFPPAPPCRRLTLLKN